MKALTNLFVILILLVLSCSHDSNPQGVSLPEASPISQPTSNQPKAQVQLTLDAQIQAGSWMSFSTWQQNIRLLKEGDDLFFSKENATIVEFFTNLENAIPLSLASNGLTGRLKVVKTSAFSFKEALSLFGPKDRRTSAAKEALLISHNNLLQFINQTVEKNALPDFNKPIN